VLCPEVLSRNAVAVLVLGKALTTRIERDKLQAYHDILKSKHYKYLNPGIVKQP